MREQPWYNLYGTISELLTVDARLFHKAHLQSFRHSKSTHYWQVKDLPLFVQLVLAYQDHLRQQHDIACEMEAKAMPIYRGVVHWYDRTTPSRCNCLAWFQIRLPCHHILRAHLFTTVTISEAQQREYVRLVKPLNSMEVSLYWSRSDQGQLSMEDFDVEDTVTQEPLLRDLRMHHKEAMETMNYQYWKIKDDKSIKDDALREQYLAAYVRKAKDAVAALNRFSIDQFDASQTIHFTGETERQWIEEPPQNEPATPSKPPLIPPPVPDSAPPLFDYFDRLSVSK